MTLDEIKALIEFIREHDLHEFELEQDGVKLRVKSGSGHAVHQPAMPPVMMAAPVQAAAPPPAPAGGGSAAAPAAEEGTELAIVKSPIVGTFYRASEPGAKPFVETGDEVKKGQVLCIIEAMKLMNEIDCEYDGEVVSVYVENGQPVQYGERLFAIRLRS
ncbi:MAG: acetyl-CoA carboxylase biotin carboxyl carrier protein [Vicinamibacterales bacterium]